MVKNIIQEGNNILAVEKEDAAIGVGEPDTETADPVVVSADGEKRRRYARAILSL